MHWETIFQVSAAALASIGSAAAILFALSSWLGKVWASRILENEKNSLAKELEAARVSLNLQKELVSRNHVEKVEIYRSVIDTVSKTLSAFDAYQSGRLSKELAAQKYDEFNYTRMRVYGYLGMLAPQQVMDRQDALIDHLLLVSSGQASYNWAEVRSLAIALINAIRIDIGLDKNPISYNGAL